MTTTAAPGDALLQRRDVTVLNADIADYSRLMADDEAATVATVRDYQQLVAERVSAAGGDLVNFVGDSFVAVFDTAPAAMGAAIAISREVRERNLGLPRVRHMSFRIGLDSGAVVVAEDGRYFGEPINVAARVQALADVGGINVTEAVYRELDEPGLRLIGLGPRRLKNIPERIRVYRLAHPGADGHDPARVTRPRTSSVAVLPVIGADEPPMRDLGQALHLELVAALGHVPGLRVIDVAVATVTGDASRELAADLGAAYSLATGLARAGTRLRAYAELIETATFNRVWARRWEGTTEDPFALLDTYTVDTTHALEVELVLGEPARIYRTALDGEALRAVYQGWYHLIQNTRSGWRRATQLFADALAADPEGAIGPGLMSFVLWWGVRNNLSEHPERDLRQAAIYAEQGAARGDQTGLAHTVVAALRLHDGGDLDAALEDATRALEIRPTCDASFGVHATVQCYLGAWESAVDSSRHAIELSLSSAPWYSTVLAGALYVGEQYHDAAETAERLVHDGTDNQETLLILAAAQQALGLRRRARATVATLMERHPGLRRDDAMRRHPFRDPQIVERWGRHLAAAGLP